MKGRREEREDNKTGEKEGYKGRKKRDTRKKVRKGR